MNEQKTLSTKLKILNFFSQNNNLFRLPEVSASADLAFNRSEIMISFTANIIVCYLLSLRMGEATD